ncbi:MAG: S8 family serine peptidase, partial [Caldilinea sp.]|nr:S8 family serine peptidase [Caldilinea sp.]
MSDKFIALRREPRTERAQRERAETEETRAALAARAPREEMPERLTDLGLVPVDVCEEAPEVRHNFQKLPYLDAYVVETPDERLERQAKEVLDNDYVIVPNFELSMPTPSAGRSYARKPQVAGAWPDVSGIKQARAMGLTGEGVTVCMLDTGVDADHLELRRKVIDFRYIPLNTAAGRVRDCRGFDVDGHGTHVAGIIAGENIGVAPGVELMVAAVLESETLKTSLERVVVALDWLLSQFRFEENLGKAVIVNMSLGFSKTTLSRKEYADAVTGLRSVIDTLVTDFDVLPITAVGNEGKGKVRAPAYFP